MHGTQALHKLSAQLTMKSPWLSLQESGGIHHSQGLVESVGSELVDLFFYVDSARIGIEPAAEDEPDAVRIRKAARQQSRASGAETFMKRWGIKTQRAHQVPVYGDGAQWVADLTGMDGISLVRNEGA